MNGTRRDGRGFPGREWATRRPVSSGFGPSGAFASFLFLLLCPPLIGADGHAQEPRMTPPETGPVEISLKLRAVSDADADLGAPGAALPEDVRRLVAARAPSLADDPAPRVPASARLDRLLAAVPGSVAREGLDPGAWWRLRVADPDEARALLEALNRSPAVDTAYLAPEPVPPPGGWIALPAGEAASSRGPASALPAPTAGPDAPTVATTTTTPDFTNLQLYFADAPIGTGVRAVRHRTGAQGGGVRLVDIENDWLLAHEDLGLPASARRAGSECPAHEECHTDHGTAVLGILAALENDYGITGGAPRADVGLVTPWYDGRYDPGRAILDAAAVVEPGDVILVQLQAAGPQEKSRYAPIEWIPEVRDAIRLATLAGRIVVIPAGNGRDNLDAAHFEGRFGAGAPHSGAIMVAGGNREGGRESPSNYGARVDVNAWGCCVATTGAGDLFGNSPRNAYSRGFGGTSSASAIVAATVTALQGAVKARYGTVMDAEQMRALLRETGTAPPGGDAIGVRPDLERALDRLEGVAGEHTVEDAARQLLTGDGLTIDQRGRLDAAGNRNGRYDVGDFAALVDRRKPLDLGAAPRGPR